MLLQHAVTNDIPAIVALERMAFARRFVGQWSEERHRATLAGDDARYLVWKADSGALEAYVILRGLGEDNRAIEVKRVVVAAPERGLGRKILTDVIRMAFEELDAHRLFLDVYEDNTRARHLYESLGFVYEGALRQAARRDGTWFDLRLMSMLESEYRGRL
jgi:diamine N-acetyltransferase